MQVKGLISNEIFTLFLLALFCTAGRCDAQYTDTIAEPKIGLVLSGGGAKGLAHIGVLKVLEEAGIRPDYISGTSMGSIIGALYAMGYTANEISAINDSVNWEKLLSDRISLNKIVMEEKYGSNRYLFRFPIRNYHIKLPSGLIEGQRLEALFSELMWPNTNHENFDSLPVPFRCISVDLISGKTIEHKSGDLIKSIRASMAIPSVFTPEIMDTLLLVDGGVTRNFPVEEVRKMGADIVIGVYVGFGGTVTQEDLFSMSDVLSRAVTLAGIVDSKEQTRNVDVLITPNLMGLGTQDFAKAKQIEMLGKEAALKHLPELKALADSLNLKRKTVRKKYNPGGIYLRDIEVKGLRFLVKSYVIGQSGLEKGQVATQEDIEKAIEKVYGTQQFVKVTYSLKKHPDSTYTLVIESKEKTRAFLGFSPFYDNNRGVGLISNLTLRNYIINSSHTQVTLNIAENPGMMVQFTRLLGKKQRIRNSYFMNLYRDKLPYYEKGVEMGNYRRVLSVFGVGLKYSLGLNNEIGVLGMYQTDKTTPNIDLKTLVPEAAFDMYKTKGTVISSFYRTNTTDDLYFPSRGIIFNVVGKYSLDPKETVNSIDADTLFLDEGFINIDQKSYATLYSDFGLYYTLFKILTINVGGAVGLNSDNTGTIGYFFPGGMYADQRLRYRPFVGFSFAEIITRNYANVHLNFDLKLFAGLYFSANSVVGFTNAKAGNMLSYLKDAGIDDYYKGIGAGLKYNSPIGPVRFFVGDNNQDRQVRYYFSVGYPF